MSEQVQESVSLPKASASLADGLANLVLGVIANHKLLAGSTLAEVSADVTEAVKDLGPLLGQVGALGDEAKSDPLGMAEALALAGLKVARKLLEAPAAAPAPAPVAAAELAAPAVDAAAVHPAS